MRGIAAALCNFGEHAIRRIERTMKTSKTIDQLFEEFLADQKARLSPKIQARYEQIIDLYRAYLERDWPGHSQEEYNAITSADGTYCGTFGAEDIASGFAEFLDYFMPRKVIAGNETMKAAGTVIKKLAKWLVEKGYTEDDESMREMIGEVARDLPASQKLLDHLGDWLAEAAPIDADRQIEGHFIITRTGPKADLAGVDTLRRHRDRADPGPRQGCQGLQGRLGRRRRGRPVEEGLAIDRGVEHFAVRVEEDEKDKHGTAIVRQAAYRVGAEQFGLDFARPALRDNAGRVRDWAKKLLARDASKSSRKSSRPRRTSPSSDE